MWGYKLVDIYRQQKTAEKQDKTLDTVYNQNEQEVLKQQNETGLVIINRIRELS